MSSSRLPRIDFDFTADDTDIESDVDMITLDDEDDQQPSASRVPIVDFDFTGDESDVDVDIDVISLYDEDDELQRPALLSNPPRDDVFNLLSPTARHNAPQWPLFERESLTTPEGLRLEVGDFVELKHAHPAPRYNRQGDFFCIHQIIEHAGTAEITLRGLVLKRTRYANNLLPKKTNELYLHVNVCVDDNHSAYEQNIVTIQAEDIVRRRRVNVTNATFPLFSFRDRDWSHIDEQDILHHLELTCLWVHVAYYKNRKDKRENRPLQSELRMMSESEADTRYRMSYSVLTAPQPRGRRRPYTLLDAFCGLGGVSLGARQAGVRPRYAFDYEFAATSTYSLNQPRTRILTESVDEMINRTKNDNMHVDILHVSPPCQPFSKAHTRAGRNDEANRATLFSIDTLIENLRPRIVTFEEAEGLVRRHKQWWKAVVNMFTSHGYSATWKIVNCCDYELPQNRERVILIASCPGTTLPEIPPPTQRYTTIADALRELARHPEASHNETTGLYAPITRTYAPYNADRFAYCITTGGGDGRPGTYHPSGTRDFTIRELAMLQGFPADFEFAGGLTLGDCRKQIGNAVPPPLAKVIFEAVRESLEKDDERITA